ncbi:tetratricopeptide repeat protein 9C [Aplysia californica]|uniref:peptidylprolyl isomerase n=1 Tax=Aplysia californica TaxID=6500 RepID=A0ABM0JDI7_APLCA|nr:tetratricopeptide repeat protein 9C [Aplysia californica]
MKTRKVFKGRESKEVPSTVPSLLSPVLQPRYFRFRILCDRKRIKTMDGKHQSSELTDDDKVLKARELKDKGNAAFKEGQYQRAVGSYHRAMLYIKGLSINSPSPLGGLAAAFGENAPGMEKVQMSPEMEAEARRLSCDCHNNLAACLLKESEPKYRRVIDLCNKALESCPGNVKALYRKGTSLYALGDFEEALTALEKAGQDASVRKHIDLCKVAIKKQDKELSQKYKAMFKS